MKEAVEWLCIYIGGDEKIGREGREKKEGRQVEEVREGEVMRDTFFLALPVISFSNISKSSYASVWGMASKASAWGMASNASV